LALNLNLSPKVSAASVVLELDKAPSEIAPGLSVSLLPPVVVSGAGPAAGNLTLGTTLPISLESGHSYPSPPSNSLLLALNESSHVMESVPALEGLGFSTSSVDGDRLSDVTAASGGADVDDEGDGLYSSSVTPLFPLGNMDSLYSGGGVDVGGSSSNGTSSYGYLRESNNYNNQSLMFPASGAGGDDDRRVATLTSSSSNKSTSDDDIFVQDFFSELSGDSPVFCSANYPSSTPPGMSRRGVRIPSNNVDRDDSSVPCGGFGGSDGGIGKSPPSEDLSGFNFGGQSVLGDPDNSLRSGGMGYGLFGNLNSFNIDNQYQDRDDEDAFWKKNAHNSKVLLGSSLLDDDDDDDLFHSARQGSEHVASALFEDETDNFNDLMNPPDWLNDSHHSRGDSSNERGGPVNPPPPGFGGHPSSRSGEILAERGVESTSSSHLSHNLMAYAPQNMHSSHSGSGSGSGVISRSRLPLDVKDSDNLQAEILTLSLTVRLMIDFRHPIQVADVCMASSLFGRWSLASALPMRCSSGDVDVYGLNIEVPSYLPYFTFKYVITDTDGKRWMEHGAPVVMDIGQRLHQQQHHRQRMSNNKLFLEQENVIRSFTLAPPGLFLYGENET
jgi:hypothetical protein